MLRCFEVGAQIRVDSVIPRGSSVDPVRDIMYFSSTNRLVYARAVTPDRDAKLGALRTLIAEKTGVG